MLERLEWLEGTLLPMAIRYKTVDVQASEAGDRMSEVVPEIVGLQRTISEYAEKLAAHQRKAERIICQIERPEYRLLLRLYYLHDPLLTWSEVAQKMNYSEDAVKHMHGYALIAAQVDTK